MPKPKTPIRPPDQININFDRTPILYTDNINIVANKSGIVLNIMQRLGNTNRVDVVARVGMSREHAKEFVEKMGKLLLVTEGTKPGKELN
jgi:hypothetical protein